MNSNPGNETTPYRKKMQMHLLEFYKFQACFYQFQPCCNWRKFPIFAHIKPIHIIKMFFCKRNARLFLIKASTPQKTFLLGLLFWLFVQNIAAQYNIDSIKALSYQEFENYFRNKTQIDSLEDIVYAQALLAKAKQNSDTLRMADAYCQLSKIHKYSMAIQYADSLILISRNLKNNSSYPAMGYYNKAIFYYYSTQLQKAIKNYVIAHQFAEKSKNDRLSVIINYNIGIVKTYLGEKEEALEIFRNNVRFIKSSKISNKNKLLSNMLIGLADAYISNQKYDSASMIIDKGIELCLQNNYLSYYSEFLNLCGINYYHMKKYQASIDSILKAIKIYDLKTNVSFAYLYLGKSNQAIGNIETARTNFIKVDSFLCNTNYVACELLETYTPLIEYYKEKNNYIKQLFYTNQLIKFDSIFDTTKEKVTKDIEKNYEIPLLLASKEKLIDKLNNKNRLSTKTIYLLITFSILLILIASYFIVRNRKYRKRGRLQNKLDENASNKSSERETRTSDKGTKEANVSSGLDQELVDTILEKLEKFEQSNCFTSNKYDLKKLAKELQTNSSYLSKIINEHKGLNFSNYLKNLRIDFAISLLENEPKYRTFTIQAIAEEVGFNKAQSFSTAFQKKTGIYPSDFIKQLEKEDMSASFN